VAGQVIKHEGLKPVGVGEQLAHFIPGERELKGDHS